MKILADTRNMDEKQWLQTRRKGIGGSDAAAVANVSKWKSPFEVYLEKTGELDPEFLKTENEPVYWGRKLEDIVADEFAARSGRKVRRKYAVCQDDTYPFMIANVDREIVGEPAGLECKTTSAWNKNCWDMERVPDEYMLQCQHYMKVMNWEYMYLAVLIGGQQFKWMRIDRDEDLIFLLISLEQKFWERVQKKDPPPIFGNSSDTEILKYLYPDAKEEEPVKLSDEALNLIEQYQQATEEEKAARYRKDEASNRMKAMLQDHSEGIWGSYRIYWKNVVSRKLDTKRLKTESPDIYEKYLSETSYRKFGIKEDKLNG